MGFQTSTKLKTKMMTGWVSYGWKAKQSDFLLLVEPVSNSLTLTIAAEGAIRMSHQTNSTTREVSSRIVFLKSQSRPKLLNRLVMKPQLLHKSTPTSSAAVAPRVSPSHFLLSILLPLVSSYFQTLSPAELQQKTRTKPEVLTKEQTVSCLFRTKINHLPVRKKLACVA